MGARRKTVETPEYAGMVRRMIRAHGRRVAQADPEDLADLIALRAELDAAIVDAVAGQLAVGRSWADVARGAGVSRQTAHEKWSRAVRALGERYNDQHVCQPSVELCDDRRHVL